MTLSLQARCRTCHATRKLWGPFKIKTGRDVCVAESLVDREGAVHAYCQVCGYLMDVALFQDGAQIEEWISFEEYEIVYSRRRGVPVILPN